MWFHYYSWGINFRGWMTKLNVNEPLFPEGFLQVILKKQ